MAKLMLSEARNDLSASIDRRYCSGSFREGLGVTASQSAEPTPSSLTKAHVSRPFGTDPVQRACVAEQVAPMPATRSPAT
jgi:hypothetical protein